MVASLLIRIDHFLIEVGTFDLGRYNGINWLIVLGNVFIWVAYDG